MSEAQPSKIARVSKAVGSLMQIHVEVAKREAERDRARLTSGSVFIVLAVGVLLGFLLMGHVAALFGLHGVGLSFAMAALAIMGIDLVLLLIFALGARSKFNGQLLPETRSLLRRTWQTITRKDDAPESN